MKAADFKTHREQCLAKMPVGSIALIPAERIHYRNADAEHRFRQDSTFYYLTGYPEPNALLILKKTSQSQESILFNMPRDPKQEQWTGARVGQERACSEFGMDIALPSDTVDQNLPELLADCDRVYYPIGQNKVLDQQVHTWVNALKRQVRSGVSAPTEFVDIATITDELRLIKNPNEIQEIQQASDISAAAHLRAMRACKPGMNEQEIEAELMHEFICAGAHAAAYTPIVAGGKNACVLHYVDNNQRLNEGDLLLIDAGAEYHNYASDITRTFPVSGRFSDAQKALYEVVLLAQEAAIEAVQPGQPWATPNDVAVRVLTEGLVELGILKGEVDILIANEAYKPFYMHKIGHWMGLDVHDVGAYKIEGQWRCFQPGMVTTIEPGLYIGEHPDVDQRWWNIGIRIEDDVLVTAQGPKVLTAAVPKTVEAIEAIMAESQ